MAEKSIYSRGESGMTTGGLDGYLGPQAQDFSNLPEHIEEAEETDKADDTSEVDCSNPNSTEAVCQIAEAERQLDLRAKGEK